MTLATILDEPEALLVTSPGLMMLQWRVAPTPTLVRRLADAFHQSFRASNRLLHLLVLSSDAPMVPDSPTRAALAQALRETEKYYASVSIALLCEGFVAASVRATLTGLHLLVRPPYPVKIFGTLPEATTFLERQARGLDVGLLVQAARKATG
jgi:hypothetical protein